MKETDVLIIGGSAAGMVAALTGKSSWPAKKFTLVKMQKDAMVPCGIPYIFGTLDSVSENIMPVDGMMEQAGVESITNRVTSLDLETRTATLESGEKIRYDRLVMATGSVPVKPTWLNGTDLKKVFVIPKDKSYLEEMNREIRDCRKIVVVGAGFIGVELSDELKKNGREVTLVEKMPDILSAAFDKDLAGRIEQFLDERGVKIVTGTGVKEIKGKDGAVHEVLLENGETLQADAVVLSMGYEPNSTLAREAGIPVDQNGFITVDEYMRTQVPGVFAVGDCAEKRDFVTRKKTPVMLASTACAEARIAGLNLYNLHVVKTFSGTIAIYSTAIGTHGFGTAGITESRAREEGFVVETGLFEGVDRHPGKLPDAHKQVVKLVAARESGIIIGGGVIGGLSAGELTNLIGLAIENKMTAYNLLMSQIGTHPCLTASPAGYPLIKAAEMIVRKIMKNGK
ncbi:MAG: FAD-dependent oxidoreductase [Bacteroidales bacterium]